MFFEPFWKLIIKLSKKFCLLNQTKSWHFYFTICLFTSFYSESENRPVRKSVKNTKIRKNLLKLQNVVHFRKSLKNRSKQALSKNETISKFCQSKYSSKCQTWNKQTSDTRWISTSSNLVRFDQTGNFYWCFWNFCNDGSLYLEIWKFQEKGAEIFGSCHQIFLKSSTSTKGKEVFRTAFWEDSLDSYAKI